jgi:hypothetical protein
MAAPTAEKSTPAAEGSAPSAEDLELAQQLFYRVEHANGQIWRGVTTILDLFGVRRLTPEVRQRLATALDTVGLESRPTLREAERYESIRLSIPDQVHPLVERDPEVAAPEDTGIVHITEWRKDSPPRRITYGDIERAKGAVWIEVDPGRAKRDALLAALTEKLDDDIPGGMVDDLLDAEPFPKVEYWDDQRRRRSVSAFRAVAEEGREGFAGRLVFQLLELIAGDRWLVSCWHTSRVFEGAREGELPADAPDPPPELPGHLREAVARRWRSDKASTAGELGTLALYSLAVSYTDVRRMLHAWLEGWELEFFARVSAGRRDFDLKSLIDLRGLIGQFAKRLRAMKLPRELEHGQWFADCATPDRSESIDGMLDRGLDDLGRLMERVRSAFDLVQIELSTIQQQAAEGLQRRLELITAVLLVPTLIAGIFGANTSLPGRERWAGFWIMVAAMIVWGILAYVYLRRQRWWSSEGLGTRAGRTPTSS